MKVRAAVAALVLAGLPALGACGDDDDTGLGADERRYCALTRELEAIGGRVFAELPEEPTEDEFAAANRRFVDQADEELDELVDVAPAEIEDEVDAYVEHFRAQARGEDADVSDERLVEWEEQNCPA